MKQITIQDMKRAVAYVNNGNCTIGNINDLADEDFLACHFGKHLKMGNIRIANVVTELMRIHNLDLPLSVFHDAKDNSVGALMQSINDYLATSDDDAPDPSAATDEGTDD